MSWISILGIALGVCILIWVLSVMNGFSTQVKLQILKMTPPIQIMGLQNNISKPDISIIQNTLKHNPNIINHSQFVSGQAMITHHNFNGFIYFEGVNPDKIIKVLPGLKSISPQILNQLKNTPYGIIINQNLANQLGVFINSPVNLILPKSQISPFGLSPVIKTFKIIGILHNSSPYIQHLGLINILAAQKLKGQLNQITGFQVSINNPFNAPNLSNQIQKSLNSKYLNSSVWVQSWTAQNQTFFNALKMEKTMTFFILMLIIAIASFNMLSAMVMMVRDKQSEIAILKTIGCSSGFILRIFLFQGVLTGLIGIIIGVIFGILGALNITKFVNWIQNITHTQFVNANVYMINFLPSQLKFSDVWHVCLIAFILSLLATIYPAYKASKTAPVKALRYD